MVLYSNLIISVQLLNVDCAQITELDNV